MYLTVLYLYLSVITLERTTLQKHFLLMEAPIFYFYSVFKIEIKDQR